MIDVYAESALFPKDSRKALGLDLTKAVLRAEGVAQPGTFHLRNTAAFLHLMEEGTMTTAAGDDIRNVRVQVVTPPNALSRPGQIQLVREISEITFNTSGLFLNLSGSRTEIGNRACPSIISDTGCPPTPHVWW